MSIVVTTPTGHIGSRVVQLLIQAGVRPTILVRDPARLSDEVRAASDVKQGNLSDRDFVLKATEGAETLFWLIPTDYTSDDPVGGILKLGEIAAEAIKTNKIARTVLLSSEGAQSRNDTFIGALGKVEDLLNATGASVLTLRPGYFFTNLLMSLEEFKYGTYSTLVPLDLPLPWNDPRDIGDVVAARLLSKEWAGQSVQSIHGPKHLSFAEVGNIISAATGKTITAQKVSADDYRNALLGAGMPHAVAEGFVRMETSIGEGIASEAKRSFVTTTPTTLEAWAYANLKPVLE